MAAVTGMDYIMYVPDSATILQEKIDVLLAQDEVLVERKRKEEKEGTTWKPWLLWSCHASD